MFQETDYHEQSMESGIIQSFLDIYYLLPY